MRRGKEQCGATQGVMKAIGENQCGQEQTQTKHEWDDMNDGDDRDRPQMADDDANDSQARYRVLVARSSYLSQDRPDPKNPSRKVREIENRGSHNRVVRF